MEITLLHFNIILLLGFLSWVLLVVFAILYYRQSTDRIELMRKNQVLQLELEKLINDATIAGGESVGKIIAQAYEKSTEIITRAKVLTGESQAALSRELSLVSSEYELEFKKLLEKTEGETAKIQRELLKKLTQDTQMQIDALHKGSELVMRALEGSVSKAAETELETVRKEIAQYREQQLEYVQNRLMQLAETAVVYILGRAVSLEDQEDLVIKGLEEAKKDHVL